MRHAVATLAFDTLMRAADTLTRAADNLTRAAAACRIARAARANQLTQALSHELGFRF